MLFLYNWFLLPLSFALTILLWPLLPQKYRDSFKLKWRYLQRQIKLDTNSAKKTILIHAASGEIEYAKPIIREIKKQLPNYQILVTFSSPSFLDIFTFESELDYVALPFDWLWLCDIFLKKWQVHCVLITRSDLWLNFIYAAYRLNIPIIFFAKNAIFASLFIRGFGFRLFRGFCR